MAVLRAEFEDEDGADGPQDRDLDGYLNFPHEDAVPFLVASSEEENSETELSERDDGAQ